VIMNSINESKIASPGITNPVGLLILIYAVYYKSNHPEIGKLKAWLIEYNINPLIQTYNL